jgi:hypothetical protein
MKVVHHVNPPCDCHPKIEQFALERADAGHPLGLGSIVECDCGQEYRLTDSQRDGAHWVWCHPDSGDMGKR